MADRLAHTAGVVRPVVALYLGDWMLLQAAWLHDIGYESGDRATMHAISEAQGGMITLGRRAPSLSGFKTSS